MKDHRERSARLQLIAYMFAGHSWQTAVTLSQSHVSRSTAYRLRKLARDEDTAALAFLDDRHGHPYKLTEPVRVWMVDFCTNDPKVASSRVQTELKTTFGVEVSISQINRVRAAYGVTKQGRGRVQAQGEKN